MEENILLPNQPQPPTLEFQSLPPPAAIPRGNVQESSLDEQLGGVREGDRDSHMCILRVGWKRIDRPTYPGPMIP